MTFKRRLKTFGIWLLFWGGVIAAAMFIITFPDIARFALLGACGGALAVATWGMAETFIDD